MGMSVEILENDDTRTMTKGYLFFFINLPPLPPLSPLLNSLLPLDKRHDLGPVEQVWWGRLVELCLKLFVKSLPPNTIWKTFEQLKGKEGGREERRKG